MTNNDDSRSEHERAAVRRAKMFFLAAAFFSFLLSVGLWFSGDRERGLFVGIWVPSICSAGALILAGRKGQ